MAERGCNGVKLETKISSEAQHYKKQAFGKGSVAVLQMSEKPCICVHETLVRQSSPHLRSKLYKARDDQELTAWGCDLEGEDHATVERYVDWMYGGKLAFVSENVWDDFGKAYQFGNKVEDDNFVDYVTDAILLHVQEEPNSGYAMRAFLTETYAKCAGYEVTRKFLLELGLFLDRTNSFGEAHHGVGRTSLDLNFSDALLAYSNAQPEKAEGNGSLPYHFNSDSCTYHRHVSSGTPCYKTRFAV